MYGLMKSHACSRNAKAAHARRLHYCGACKTMGRLYGQRSRMLLNNDAVFLAELLTALSPEAPSAETWARAYQSYNCMALPTADAEMPIALQVAATATLVMSEFKVADQITDASHGGWKMIGRIYSQGFHDASARMKEWGFPVKTLWDWYQAQQKREQEIRATPGARSATETLAYAAEPTATVTGLVFQHGARVAGAAEDAQETMYTLGYAFGALVYVLDAYEDDRKDARHGDFNALQAAFGAQGATLTEEAREAAIRSLQETAAQIRTALESLPIAPEEAAIYHTRLQANLSEKLGIPIVVHRRADATPSACATHPTGLPKGVRARWRAAGSHARTLASEQRAERAGVLSAVRMPFAFLSTFLVTLLFPREALGATSVRACNDVAFSLLTWGAAFQALLAAPQRLLPNNRLAFAGAGSAPVRMFSSGGPQVTETVVVTRRRRRFCSGCDCCCDGCCDSCDCACCACESCDCCCNGAECCSADCCSACDCCSSCG